MRSAVPAGLLLISVWVPVWAFWTPGGWEEKVEAGTLHRRQNQFAEAEKCYLAALQDLGNEPESDYGRAVVWNNLGFLRRLQNRLSEAEELFKRALALRSQRVQDKSDWLAGTIQ